MNKIGCFGWAALLIMFSALISGLQNPKTVALTIGILVLFVAIIALAIHVKTRGGKNHSTELLHVADMLDAWAAGNLRNGTADTEGDEVALFDVTNVELLEFKSTGSSYSGGHVGISFPLFGRIRGNVGGSQGQITRNPEALLAVDTGTVKVTSERIIFIGEKEARVFDLDKVLDFELGPNGLWVKLAMSNKTKREGFQHMALDQITLGMTFGIANSWSNDGKDAAVQYAKNLAQQIRDAMAAEAAAKATKG